MKTKKKVLGLLAIACVGVAALGAANVKNAVEVSAETPTAFSTFAMEDGASIYVGDIQSTTAKQGNGIRWHITMDATQYAALSTSGYTDIKFGILVAPEEGYDLTEVNVFGENAIYDWAEKQADGSYVYSGNKKRIANFYTSELYAPVDKDNANYVEFYGALTNLKDGADEGETDTTNNLAREFRGVGYIEYKVGEETKYIWAGDDDNVRSMAYVAQCAIADNDEDAPTAEVKTWLGDNYVAKSSNVNWHIEHYLQKADGTYEDTPYSTTTHMGAPSATASAYNSPIAIDGYHMNELKTEGWQGFVWANNSTTLKLYYEKNDLSVTYGDYQVSFVQNDYKADAMENKIVDGKLVTVVGDSILDNFNKGIGNTGYGNRPELVISGLNAGEVDTGTGNATLAFEDAENGMLVPYYNAQGKYYGIGKNGENTWTASNLVADENGQIAFGSWYGAMGTYTWENIEVTSDEPVATYDGYQVRILKDNAAPVATTFFSRVNDDGKLVTTTNGEIGYASTRPALEITGLIPYGLYTLTLGVTTNNVDAYFYKPYNGTKYPDWFQVWASNNYSNSGTMQIRADENGKWLYEELFYTGGANTIVWDISIAGDPIATYGEYTLLVNPCEEDRNNRGVSVVLNTSNQIEITTGTAFGNVSTAGEESALYTGGLTAGQSYTIHLAYTVSGIADADDGTAGKSIQEFRKVRSTSAQGRFTFVSGTATDGTSLAGKNINGFYGNGDYVIKLTGTADANGMIRFGGFYAGGGQVITYTGITIV